MTERTFSLAEVERLVPEIGVNAGSYCHRYLRYFSAEARSVSGHGNYRRYTVLDVAVMRAVVDLMPFCGDRSADSRSNPLRNAVLSRVGDGQTIDLTINELRVIYEPRWVTADELAAVGLAETVSA